MTWEIAVGFFSIVSAFFAVMKVVVRINKTLVSLDLSVSRLNEYMERQSAKNEKIFNSLDNHERRLARLEVGTKIQKDDKQNE